MAKPARRLSIFLAAIALMASVFGGRAEAASLYKDPRYAAIVVDAATGEVLYARRADQPRYPASISKVMTLYLVFEALSTGKLHLDDRVVMTANGARQPPSKLGLRPGQSITVDQAVRTLALLSANDVAVAIAEKIGGSESQFAAMMTLRAHELGMVNTRFVNPHGLPDTRQISTARDIAILSRAVMRDYPQYYSYFGQRTYDIQGRRLTNHNGLLATMPGVDGIKTGFTNASGYNLAASATRGGRRLVAVVLGGTSTSARNQNVADLLDAGFEVLSGRNAGQTITIAAQLKEPDDVSGPMLASAEEATGAAKTAAGPTRVGLPLTGAVPAAAITPGSFSSAWLKPLAFDKPQPSAEEAGLKTAALTADEAVGCEPVKVVKTKTVKTKARKGKKARTRKVQVTTWERPKGCGPAPVLAKASYSKSADEPLSAAAEAATPDKAVAEKTAPKSEKTASAKTCISAAKAKTKAAKARRAACLKEAKAEAAETKAPAKTTTAKTGAADKAAKGAGGGYLIQVGAYKSQADAKTQLDKIAKRFASVVAPASSRVQNAKGTYRARFQGFSQAEAKAACQAISAKGEHCMVLAAS